MRKTLWSFAARVLTWRPRFGAKHVLQHDRDRMIFRLVAPNGHIWEFDDFTSVCSEEVRALDEAVRKNRAPGMFKRHIGPAGEDFQEIKASYKACQIQQVERSAKQNGKQIIERFVYSYLKDTDPNAGRLEFVTLQRGEKNAKGEVPSLRRAAYTYYGNSEPFGNLGDLKTVTAEFYDFSENRWERRANAVQYYRYDKRSYGTYCQGMLTAYVGPETFHRLKESGNDPLTMNNDQLKKKADLAIGYYGKSNAGNPAVARRVHWVSVPSEQRFHVFKYEHVFPGADVSRTDSDNLRRFLATSSTDLFASRYIRTTETRTGATVIETTCNSIGRVLSRELKGDGKTWTQKREYHPKHGGLTKEYTPSFFASNTTIGEFEDLFDDFLPPFPGLPTTIQLLQLLPPGRFSIYNYFEPRDGIGYIQEVRLGPAPGTHGKGRQAKVYNYSKPYHYAGQELHLLTGEVTPNVTTDGAKHRHVRLDFVLHHGTAGVHSLSVKQPAVPREQNGSGEAASTTTLYDRFANPIWTRDPRNVLTFTQFDVPSGQLVKAIQDANTSKTGDFGRAATLLSSYRSKGPSGTPALQAPTGAHVISKNTLDRFGRVVETIGPPQRTITDTEAQTLQPVRAATWTVFDEKNGQVRSAQGYTNGVHDAAAKVLINPIQIVEFDRDGRAVQEASAVRASTVAPLGPKETFDRASFVRLTQTVYDDQQTVKTKRFHDIKAGKYSETVVSANLGQRQTTVTDATGTVRQTTFEARGLPIKIEIGTLGNLKTVSEMVYDYGLTQGNGNLTRRVAHVDSKTRRVTSTRYDWLDRPVESNTRLETSGDPKKSSFTNDRSGSAFDYADTLVDEPHVEKHYHGAAKSSTTTETRTDILGRVYRREINGATSTDSLLELFWYDAAGNVIKQKLPQLDAYHKFEYDRLGRQLGRVLVTDPLGKERDVKDSFERASTSKDNIVHEQLVNQFDNAGNLFAATAFKRKPESGKSSHPLARVTKSFFWHDPLGRLHAVADYGTSAAVGQRPNAVRRAAGDAHFVTTFYNQRGEACRVHDKDWRDKKRGEHLSEFDDAGRLIRSVRNANSDKQRLETRVAYRPDDQAQTLTVANADTGGEQVTRYEYQTDLQSSDLLVGNLRTAVIAPDGARTSFDYNRQGEVKRTTDPNGTVHGYRFDGQGRLRVDQVEQFGSGVGLTVEKIQFDFDEFGRMHSASSYDLSQSVLNKVDRGFNDFGAVTSEAQPHRGADGLGETVTYEHESSSDGQRRLKRLKYPGIIYSASEDKHPDNQNNGQTAGEVQRVVRFNYDGTPANDALNRVARIEYQVATNIRRHGEKLGSDIELVSYTYGGLADINATTIPEPKLSHDLGDYDQLDTFGRLKGFRWRQGGGELEAVRYGYDAADNRRSRQHLLKEAQKHNRDELYEYDRLLRLETFQRGKVLVSSSSNGELQKPKIEQGTQTARQSWSLDSTGNWKSFDSLDSDTDSKELKQTRTHTAANEIDWAVPGWDPDSGKFKNAGGRKFGEVGWCKPKYDAAGNMIRMPQPRNPRAWYDCIFDAWNRLVEIRDDNGKLVAGYEYDGLGRRIVKHTVGGDGKDRWRHYYYSVGGQVLEERESTTLEDVPLYPDRQYIWGVDGQLLLADRGEIKSDTFPRSVRTSRYYPLRDGHGNTTALLDYDESNKTSQLSGRFGYMPYGEPKSLNNDFTRNTTLWHDFEYLHAGLQYDHETGLYHTHHRQYHPLLGVWTQRDPAGVGENLYAYTDDNPISRIDPSGLDWLDETDRFFAGFADTITFGGTTKLRAAIYGDIATRNHQGVSFTAGQITGAAVGLAIGFGAGAGVARAGVWGSRLARGYALAGDIVGVAQSSYNLATGQATGWDALGFLPTVGWGLGAMKRARPGARVLEALTPIGRGGRKVEVDEADLLPWLMRELRGGISPTGGTTVSRNIAYLIETERMHVAHLSDQSFDLLYRLGRGNFDPSDVAAFAYRRSITLRRTDPDIVLSAVHEGSHVLDNLSGSKWRQLRLVTEFRAYRAERMFALATGRQPGLSNIGILKTVLWHYGLRRR